MTAPRFLKRYSSYQIAVFLSTLSMGVGVFREFIIVGLLGFTLKNDMLQIYLSVIYTISLMIDAMRLSCLNLMNLLSLPRILLAASIVSLPAAILVGIILYFSTDGMNGLILTIAVLGGFFHLTACLLITYKQRHNVFLSAQVINVMPNVILIPGIIICYGVSRQNMINAIVILTSVIPVIQCVLLLRLPNRLDEQVAQGQISLWGSLMVFARHFSTTVGEQLFQIICRAAFFNFGPGYLSVFSISVRCYSALRFILIDSYIGSRLSKWKHELERHDQYLFRVIHSTGTTVLLASLAFGLCLLNGGGLIQYAVQMGALLIFGFYFSTLVRIVYFRINHLESNIAIVMKFALYEILFALLAWLFTWQVSHSILPLLWIGYVAKPLSQLLLLRKRFSELAMTQVA